MSASVFRATVSALVLAVAASSAAWSQTAVQTADPLFKAARDRAAAAEPVPNRGRAKNVILFIGDGMGISTITASRIFEGQSRGVDGESNSLSFESLPYLALSKTYSADTQVPDSAATATAMTTGVKTRNKVIGLGPAAPAGQCDGAAASTLETIAEAAKARGKAVGVVTTTRITHATPASTYAHTPFRDWEGDQDMPEAALKAGCQDIARQLIAHRFDVALGGGRTRFFPPAAGGKRKDGRDLVREWTEAGGRYVADVAALKALSPTDAAPVLGLFGPEHLPFEADRAKEGQGVPTLTEMATAAVDRLKRDPDGYFLMVEGGRIDMANHLNDARRAMTETAEFSRAIRAVLERVDLKDTLVIVTADHSHGLVINGYSPRNAPILGLAGNEGEPAEAKDGKPYETIVYATGPGGAVNAARRTPDASDIDDTDHVQSALVPLASSAHSGEDVAIFAGGPQAHLFRGVVEENYIYHVMRRTFGFDAPSAGPAKAKR